MSLQSCFLGSLLVSVASILTSITTTGADANSNVVVWETITRDPNSFLKDNPCYSADKLVYTYRVPESKTAEIPRMISTGLIWGKPFPVREIQLFWQENENSVRKLHVSISRYTNGNNDADSLRIELPDGNIAFMQTPQTLPTAGRNQNLSFDVFCRVHAGENRVVLRNTSMAHTNEIVIEKLTLSQAREQDYVLPKPVISIRTGKLGNIFSDGENPRFEACVYNTSNDVKQFLKFDIVDFNKKTVFKGKMPVTDGTGKKAMLVEWKNPPKGYFEMRACLVDGQEQKIALGLRADDVLCRFGIMEPDKHEKPDSESPFGIIKSDFLKPYFDYDSDMAFAELAAMAGVKWERIWIDWDILEPKKGEFHWELYDKAIDSCLKNNICIIATILQVPLWASRDKDMRPDPMWRHPQYMYSPPDMASWGESMSAIAKHYMGKINHWEIGNEVDEHPGSIYWINGTTEDYFNYLKTAYQAIKKVDPGIKVHSGGLVTGKANPFTHKLLAMGGGEYFDIHDIHYDYGKEDSTAEIRRILKQYQVEKDIWNTEIHWEGKWAKEAGSKEERVVKGFISELSEGAKHVDYFTFDGCFDIMNEDVKKVGDYDLTWGNVGIINTDYTPRPAYLSFRTMTRQLGKAKYLGSMDCEMGVRGYLFDRGNKTPALVFWADDGKSHQVTIPVGAERVELVDIMDNSTSTASPQGELKMSVDKNPVFVRGADMKVCSLTAFFSVKPIKETLLRGKKMKIDVSIKNTLAKKLNATVKIKAPETWNAPKDEKLVLSPNEETSLPVEILVPENAEHGEYPIVVEAVFQGEENEKAWNMQRRVTVIASEKPLETNILTNGGFETDTQELNPWDSRIVSEEAYKGKRSLLLNNNGKPGGFTYGGSNFKVVPGEKYLISFWNKGTNCRGGGHFTYYDKNGKQIAKEETNFYSPCPEWKQVYRILTIPKDAYGLQLNVFAFPEKQDGKTYLDEFELKQLKENTCLTENRLRYQGKCLKAKKAVQVDGDLSEWKDVEPLLLNQADQAKNCVTDMGPADIRKDWGGEKDLSATVKIMWDETNLYMAVSVRDDHFCQEYEGFEKYKGDCVEFALDPENKIDENQRVELSFGKTKKGLEIGRSAIPDAPNLPVSMYKGVVKEAVLAAKNTPDGINYELSVPLAGLGPLKLSTGKNFGFSILVDDNDGKGRKGWICWGDGIGEKKDPSLYGVLTCVGD